jgi:hypothetical protein
MKYTGIDILRYLIGTMDMRLFCLKVPKLELTYYIDTSYLSDLHNGRSQQVTCLHKFIIISINLILKYINHNNSIIYDITLSTRATHP